MKKLLLQKKRRSRICFKTFITVVCAVFIFPACSNKNTEKGRTSEEPVTQSAPQKPALPPIISANTLTDAIKIVKPAMTDTFNDMSPGAASLATWSISHLKWSELNELPATRYALVMKDSDEERGKKLCATGIIVEVASEKTEQGKVYHGGLFDEDRHVYRFTAVGSTGELVAQSQARFCGVVIGREDYSNSAGGTAHAVYLVGMFDLPENKAGK